MEVAMEATRAGHDRIVAPAGLRTVLRSLSSATLTVGSAACFLVLVTMLSFVPEGGDAPADQSIAWQLRGALPPVDAPSPARERMAQGGP